MAWLNAQGNPVKIQPTTIQLDLPGEAVGDEALANGTVNWFAVIMAAVQLFAALKSGDPAAIAAAFQALVKAIMGT